LRSLVDTWALLTHGSAITQSRDALLRQARADDPVAEFQLGMRYRDGSWAVNRDPARAEFWLQRAADNGNSLARQALDEQHEN
jgi:TPR repeat protein